MIKAYLAAPIVGISEDIRQKIIAVKTTLRMAGIDLYVPSEHGVPNAWGMSLEEWARSIFSLDVVAIENSDWIVVCDFGRSTTAGTAWECGYAFAKGKKILIIEMDENSDYSVMMRGSSSNYCEYEEFISTHFDQIPGFFIERGRQSTGNVLN